jgi:hypothetical protein
MIEVIILRIEHMKKGLVTHDNLLQRLVYKSVIGVENAL